MSGMGSSLQLTNQTVVAAFRSALIHQGIIALLIFFLLAMLWVSVREWLPAARRRPGAAPAGLSAEPAGRRLIRVGFGVLWVVDGVLQMQSAMPLGLPSSVTEPAAAGAPGWVRHLVDFGGQAWSYHPVAAAASAVWIQIGIGIWLLTAARGRWSQLGGLASVGWGLAVWIFGEAFGGLFTPGLSWLFGAPGAALLYAVAGALIALPDRAWLGEQLGRRLLAGAGVFLAGMAVLQAWPGRGFWQGTLGRQPGSLTSMLQDMSQTSQPGFLASLVRGFGTFTAGHGFLVNLVVVVALAVTGTGLVAGALVPAWRRVLRPAVGLLLVLSAATWLLVQDLGVFGGLGTDPNSMIPFALLVVAGYLAVAPAPAVATAAGPVAAAEPEAAAAAAPVAAAVPAEGGASSSAGVAEPTATAAGSGWRDRLRPGQLARALGTASPRTVAAVGALGVAIIGVVPMMAASASTTASPLVAEALDGSSAPLNFSAPAFQLTNQDGRQVSLASLHGKVVLLTFLDPVCTTDCPLIAQEFRAVGQLLGAASKQVELVAIVTNPIYHQVADVQAFDRAEQLTQVPNWRYLTGSVPQLRQVWRDYGISAEILPAGSMIGHQDVAFVIGRDGRVRQELNTDPGPGTTATKSSFAVLLTDAARQALGPS